MPSRSRTKITLSWLLATGSRAQLLPKGQELGMSFEQQMAEYNEQLRLSTTLYEMTNFLKSDKLKNEIDQKETERKKKVEETQKSLEDSGDKKSSGFSFRSLGRFLGSAASSGPQLSVDQNVFIPEGLYDSNSSEDSDLGSIFEQELLNVPEGFDEISIFGDPGQDAKAGKNNGPFIPVSTSLENNIVCDGRLLLTEAGWYQASQRFADIFLDGKTYFLLLSPENMSYSDARNYCQNLGLNENTGEGQAYNARLYCPSDSREHNYLSLIFGTKVYEKYSSTAYFDSQKGWATNEKPIKVANGYSEGWSGIGFDENNQPICLGNGQDKSKIITWGTSPINFSPTPENMEQPENYLGQYIQNRHVTFRLKPLNALYKGVYMNWDWAWDWYADYQNAPKKPFFCQLSCDELPEPEMLYQEKDPKKAAGHILEKYIDQDQFLDVQEHGCWCAKMDILGMPNYVGGPNVVDDLDQICKDWFTSRACTKLNRSNGFEPYCPYGFMEYTLQFNGIHQGFDLNNCYEYNEGCEQDSCLIDRKFARKIKDFLFENGNSWKVQRGDDEKCPFTMGLRSMGDRVCEGEIPDLKIMHREDVEGLENNELNFA